MGRYMREHGLFLVGYYSRSIGSSEEAGTFTDTKVFEDLESMLFRTQGTMPFQWLIII